MSSLKTKRRQRAMQALRSTEFPVFVSSSYATVRYFTDFRSMAAELYEDISAIVVASTEKLRLVIPYSQVAAAIDEGISPEELFTYGEAYFDTTGETQSGYSDVHWGPSLPKAIQDAIKDVEPSPMGKIGLEIVGMPPVAINWLLQGDHGHQLVDASTWARSLRAVKFPEEVEFLETSARITERAIARALAEAGAGTTEAQIARIMAEHMIREGAEPEFFSVQFGNHSALGDAFPGSRAWSPCEVLKMDLGCRVNGYWSDLGRTAVLGEPSAEIAETYQALLQGQQEQLDLVRPGVSTTELFDVAVKAVRETGIPSYQRQHCGHGIGLAIYDDPLVQADEGIDIEEGMVLCLETPYYRKGWGGMIIEDTVVVTANGHRSLSVSSRDLLVVAP